MGYAWGESAQTTAVDPPTAPQPTATAAQATTTAPVPAEAEAGARSYHLVDTGVPLPSVPRAGVRVDLYMPGPSAEKPPLMLYLTGGLWDMPDDRYLAAAAAGDAMQRRGIAVAAVRYALADGYVFEECAQDVAKVVRFFVDQADHYGYDAERISLVGHESGALLAALLALDRNLLADAGVEPQRLAGAVGIRGLYDLSEEILGGHPDRGFYSWAGGKEHNARRAVSPVTHVHRQAPPFLVLYGGDDAPGYAQGGRMFAQALRAAGAKNVQSMLVPERDERKMWNLSGEGNRVAALLAEFARKDPVPQPIEGAWAVKQIWSDKPPLTSEVFWDESLVEAHAMTPRLKWAVARIFDKTAYELNAYPFETYHAIDLATYLASRPTSEVGQGDWLVVTNIRGERQVLSAEQIRANKPQLVVGLDDERNLFRLTGWYRMDQRYSWQPDEEHQPKMIRPVGAFLFFPQPAPRELVDATFATYGLTPASFQLMKADPLGPVRGVAPEIWRVLTGQNGCLACHAFRGAGARSHHARADDGQGYGAVALALEEYPPLAWWQFLFDQEAAAATIGVRPLKVEGPAARALYDLVATERDHRDWPRTNPPSTPYAETSPAMLELLTRGGAP